MSSLFAWFVGAFCLILTIFLFLNGRVQKRWSKILGFKPNFNQINLIIQLEIAKFSQEKITELMKNLNSKTIDEKTIVAMIKDKKQAQIAQLKAQEIIQVDAGDGIKAEFILDIKAGAIEKSEVDYVFESIEKLCIKSLKTCLYSDFLQFDKFKKAQYFTIEHLNIETINIIFQGYFVDDVGYKALNVENRKYIKQFGYNSQWLDRIRNYYKNLAYNVALYVFQIASSDDDVWYFQVGDVNNRNKKADKMYLAKNDPIFDTYYPPNFFGDNSSVRTMSKNYLEYDAKHDQKYKKFKKSIKLYADSNFDFNIPKYFIEHVFDKNEIATIIQKIQNFNMTIG